MPSAAFSITGVAAGSGALAADPPSSSTFVSTTQVRADAEGRFSVAARIGVESGKGEEGRGLKLALRGFEEEMTFRIGLRVEF